MKGSRAIAAVAMGALGASLALAVHAAADEPKIDLAWSAPNACPSEAAVRANVAALLSGSSVSVVGRAEVKPIGERWAVVLTLNGGERRLEADSCHALAEATALIVAMAVDPARVAANRIAREAGVASEALPDAAPEPIDAGTDAPGIEPLDAAPATPTPTPTPSPTPTPTAAPTATPTFALAAGAAGDLGTLPSAAFGPSLSFAWLPASARLELSAAYFPSSFASVTGGIADAPGGAQFSLFTATLRACYEARLASFELGPCAGVEGGVLWASIESPENTQNPNTAPSSGASALLALEAGIRGGWRFLPSWTLFGRIDALLQTNRPVFEVNGTSPSLTVTSPGAATLFQPSLFTGRGTLGLELRF